MPNSRKQQIGLNPDFISNLHSEVQVCDSGKKHFFLTVTNLQLNLDQDHPTHLAGVWENGKKDREEFLWQQKINK